MKKKSTVTVTCRDCGIPFEISIKTYRRYPEGHEFRCPKCRVEYHKLWYVNMPEEKRREVSARMSNSAKDRWKNMPPEEFEAYRKKLSEGDQAYWNNLQSEDYDSRCKQMKDMWDLMSPDQRLAHRQKISEKLIKSWRNMGDEDYLKRCEMASCAAKKYWDNISDDEMEERRKATSNRFKEYWANMSEDEFAEWNKKRMDGFNKYLHDIRFIPNTNEMNFIELLKPIDVKWSYHQRNVSIDPEFDNRFPKNPITGDSRVSPYHEWDFVIYLKKGPIFVDVDGSIHDPEKTGYHVTYHTGIRFLLRDYILFNDSQREFQTDFLPAFVVKCYNDTFDDTTEVVEIKSGKKMTLDEFIDFIKVNAVPLRKETA